MVMTGGLFILVLRCFNHIMEIVLIIILVQPHYHIIIYYCFNHIIVFTFEAFPVYFNGDSLPPSQIRIHRDYAPQAVTILHSCSRCHLKTCRLADAKNQNTKKIPTVTEDFPVQKNAGQKAG